MPTLMRQGVVSHVRYGVCTAQRAGAVVPEAQMWSVFLALGSPPGVGYGDQGRHQLLPGIP